jgi:chemotaxis methyl-accepting protein methylase
MTYGSWMHTLVRRRADRQMYLGTFFLRNRPALELMRRVTASVRSGSTVRIAVLGCSIGVEVYSILSVLRPTRPDLTILVRAVDTSQDALTVAEAGVYGAATSTMVGSQLFEGVAQAEMREMFARDAATPKDTLVITWQLDDACDSQLVGRLGLQDIVVASNFLCHMQAKSAESCLRNLVRLVKPGGYLFVAGVDLDVRTSVALDLGWEPVADLREEIHDGDPSVRADWPWRWWGLEPFDRRRADWATRYASAFRVGRTQ